MGVKAFIVGCPRTGTTWMVEMLADHPDVYHVTGDDFAHWILGKPGKESGCFQPGIGYTMPLIKMVFSMIEKDHPGKTLVEKTPWHVMCLARLFKTFPDARVILMKRNPRTVVASMLRKFPFTSVAQCARFWIDSERQASLYQNRCHVVHYEDLHTDLKGTYAKVCDFLSLPHAPANGTYEGELDIGTVDSWKRFLTPEQLDVIGSMLRNEGWEKAT